MSARVRCVPADRSVLDRRRCLDPNCTEHAITVHPSCHSTSTSIVSYESGVLRLACARCKVEYAAFTLAGSAPEMS